MLNKDHCSEIDGWCEIQKEPLTKILKGTNVSAQELLIAYCVSLYDEYGTYEEVARITQLDPRTVKKIHPISLLPKTGQRLKFNIDITGR